MDSLEYISLLEKLGCRLHSTSPPSFAYCDQHSRRIFLQFFIWLILKNLMHNWNHIQEAKAGYVLLLMSVYWMSECLPLAITSLLPIAVFPLLNIMSTNDVCSQYFKGSIAVFFCAVSLALGAEQSNLHRRVAYKILLFIGADPKWFHYLQTFKIWF